MHRIVFQRFEPGIGKFRIFTIRPNGTGLRAITKPPANAHQDVVAWRSQRAYLGVVTRSIARNT